MCGASELRIDHVRGTVTAGGHTLREGDHVTVDGRTGAVYLGEVDIRPAEPPAELDTLLAWADQERVLGVRTNADTVRETEAALRARRRGHRAVPHRAPVPRRPAAGGPALPAAPGRGGHQEALDALTDAQCEDFQALLRAVGDRPVTVRLLDAPLHEFLPHDGAYEDESQIGGPGRCARSTRCSGCAAYGWRCSTTTSTRRRPRRCSAPG